MQHVIWRNLETTEFQNCSLKIDPTMNVIIGSVISVHQGTPLWVKYSIEASKMWQTKRVMVEQVYQGNLQELILDVDSNQKWYENRVEIQELRGCEDVDLGVTPATNILPIRRLKLMQGEQATITAAWIRFPKLLIEKSKQRYMRLGEKKYEYKSDTFRAELEIDNNGMVERYGNIWEVVAKYDSSNSIDSYS